MIYIGIDPDVEKSGVAVYDTEDKSLELKTLDFWSIIEEIESYLVPVTLVIEAGWLIKKSNWHGTSKQSKTAGERIAKNVGSNHQVGKLLAKYCESKGIKYSLVKPIGKLDHNTFKKITGYKGRTNQEVRDAGMLVYGL